MSVTPTQPPVSNKFKEPQDKQRKQKRHRNPNNYGETAWETLRLVRATWALAVLTFFVAGLGVYQAYVTTNAITDQQRFNFAQITRADSQISVSRKTMQLGLRAYVGLILADSMFQWDINYTNSVVDSTTSRAKFTVKNFGQTPAYDVRIIYKDSVLHSDNGIFDTVEEHASGEGSIMTLNPLGDYAVQEMPHIFKGSDLKQLASKNKAYFLWGVIRYRDIFGKEHRTPFRFKVKEIFGSIVPDSQGNSPD